MNNHNFHKYYINILELFFILILFSNNTVLGQEGKDKRIISKQYYEFDSIKVIEDSTSFEGYLVFKIHKRPDSLIYKIDNKVYSCDVFWLSNLNYIEQDTSYYFYNFYTLLYNQYVLKNDYENDISFDYLKFKYLFEKYFQSYSDAAYFMIQALTTNIFKKVKFWTYGSNHKVGYFVYKISLNGTLISALISIYGSDAEDKLIIKKFLIPLSNFYIFRETSSFELLEIGFKESKWYPRNLFRY